MNVGSWHCSMIGADEEGAFSSSTSDSSWSCMTFRDHCLYVAMPSTKDTTDYQWVKEGVLARVIQLLRMPSKGSRERCTVKQVGKAIKRAVSELEMDARVPSNAAVAVVAVLRVDAFVAGRAPQALLLVWSGTCAAFYTDASRRTHTDLLATSSLLAKDDLVRSSVGMAAIPCPSAGVITIGLDVGVPTHGSAPSSSTNSGSSSPTGELKRSSLSGSATQIPHVVPKGESQRASGGPMFAVEVPRMTLWKRSEIRPPAWELLNDTLANRVTDFGNWDHPSLEEALSTSIRESPILLRERLSTKCVSLRVPMFEAVACESKSGSGGLLQSSGVLASMAMHSIPTTHVPIGVMIQMHRSTLVLRVRTIQYDKFECVPHAGFVVLTASGVDDALGDSHQTKWNEFRRTAVDELSPVYRREVSLPCQIDPSSQIIKVDDSGHSLTISFAIRAFSSHAKDARPRSIGTGSKVYKTNSAGFKK